MIRMKNTLLAGMAALVAISVAPAAQAIPQLRLSDGFTTITVTDGGVGDIDANVGAIVFQGSIGVFNISVTTGITKPILGSPTEPVLDLNSIAVNGTGPGTLTISFSETDFVSAGPSVNFLTAVGGVTAGSVVFDYYASASNANFATDLLVDTTGLLSGPFVDTALASEALTGLYSMTTVATIIHTANGQNSSFNANFETVSDTIEIPEAPLAPSLIAGALLLAARTIRRRKA
jgi:hypothetical protein